MALDARLDHVAVALERMDDAWPRYAGDLAGEWVAGGAQAGFASAQVRFTGGMKVEVLEPRDDGQVDFLRRFLDHSGPGPHHLTFKVPDIEEAIAAARLAGLEPVGIDLRFAEWKEAFLHPKQACGIVVQLAQAEGGWETPPPATLPQPRVPVPAELSEVTLAVADLDHGRSLFGRLLGGAPDGGDHRFSWPGGGRVRLVRPASGSPEAAWLGDRPGRLLHLAFRVLDPAAVAAAVAADDGGFEVAPEVNFGTRLRLEPATPG